MAIDLFAYLGRIGVSAPSRQTSNRSVEFSGRIYKTCRSKISTSVPWTRDQARSPCARGEDRSESTRRILLRAQRSALGGVATIGFDVTIVSVQFVHEDDSLSPPFDHMALIVNAPGDPTPLLGRRRCGQWTRPLGRCDRVQRSASEISSSHRLPTLGEGWQLDLLEPADWRPEYTFTVISRQIGFPGSVSVSRRSGRLSLHERTNLFEEHPRRTDHGRRSSIDHVCRWRANGDGITG